LPLLVVFLSRPVTVRIRPRRSRWFPAGYALRYTSLIAQLVVGLADLTGWRGARLWKEVRSTDHSVARPSSARSWKRSRWRPHAGSVLCGSRRPAGIIVGNDPIAYW